MESYLDVQHLTKSFGEKVLFDDMSFSVSEGQKVGLVARNGTGKSTLLSILHGDEGYDAGQIVYRNDIRVGYLEQTPHFNPTDTVLDACFNHEDNPEKVLRAKQVLTQLRIEDLEQKVGELSGGQLKRVALANVLLLEPDFLILDEVCNLILEIDDETIYTYRGNYSYYLEKRQERIDNARAEIARANNLYRKELDWMRRQPQARGHKARYREEAFYDLEAKAKRRIEERQMRLKSSSIYIGSKIFECQYVSKAFERADGTQKVILKDFYYNFARFEKMGIVGKNGTGKSTFVKMLLGKVEPDGGRFDIGDTVRFGYFSQEGLQFREDQKVIDIVKDIADYIDLGGGRHMTASQFLNYFLFPPEMQHNYVAKLSGGERRKLYLCTVLMRNPNFLVLDEPTNDLDIQTLQVLEEYLQDFPGCVIVISHDRYFTDKVVDHLLVFHGEGDIQDFPGNYTQYRDYQKLKSKEEDDRRQEEKKPKRERADYRNETRRKLTYKEKMEFERLEKEMGELEKEREQLEAALCSGTLSIDELTEKSKRLPEVKELIDEKEMRWLELSEIGG